MQAMKMRAGKRARMTAMAMRAMEKKNAMEMMRTTRTTTRKKSSSMKSTGERSLGPDWPIAKGLVFKAHRSFPRQGLVFKAIRFARGLVFKTE